MPPELCKRLATVQVEESLAFPALFGDAVEIEEWSFPNLYIRFRTVSGTFRLLHFEFTDYDFQPAAVEAVDPVTRDLLPPAERLRRDGGEFPGHQMLGRPFLCVTGTRAYYLHESHRPQVTGERWEARRAEFRLVDLIGYIAGKFATGSWQ